jgi:hypothetical protein
MQVEPWHEQPKCMYDHLTTKSITKLQNNFHYTDKKKTKKNLYPTFLTIILATVNTSATASRGQLQLSVKYYVDLAIWPRPFPTGT